MSKAKVRPPRTPKGEPASVTIGNQRQEITTLTRRIQTLVMDRDSNYESARQWRDRAETAERALEVARQHKKADVARLEECQAKLASTEQRFEGYRQAVADMVKS